MLEERSIESRALRGERKIWVHRSDAETWKDLCIFLDAEIYLERVEAVRTINGLSEAEGITRPTAVFLSFGEPADRHVDFTCNDAFSAFLVEEFLPWADNCVGTASRVTLCGLSLSGLAAIFAAGEYPGVVSGVLSQSPSAWWNNDWMVERGPFAGPTMPRIWLSVGNEETDENVEHAPGLLQRTSQLASCRRLSDRFSREGIDHKLNEFSGGHDPKCWASELPAALSWLLRRREDSTPRTAEC